MQKGLNHNSTFYIGLGNLDADQCRERKSENLRSTKTLLLKAGAVWLLYSAFLLWLNQVYPLSEPMWTVTMTIMIYSLVIVIYTPLIVCHIMNKKLNLRIEEVEGSKEKECQYRGEER